jgi:hypothetical protein
VCVYVGPLQEARVWLKRSLELCPSHDHASRVKLAQLGADISGAADNAGGSDASLNAAATPAAMRSRWQTRAIEVPYDAGRAAWRAAHDGRRALCIHADCSVQRAAHKLRRAS